MDALHCKGYVESAKAYAFCLRIVVYRAASIDRGSME